MRVRIIFIALFLAAHSALAALPPRYQNMKDLDVIVEFVKEHESIMSTLQLVDMKNHTVSYGNGCTAYFERKATAKPLGWVGPAEPLEFTRSSCTIQ